MEQQVQPAPLHKNLSSLSVMHVLICMYANKHMHISIAEKYFKPASV